MSFSLNCLHGGLSRVQGLGFRNLGSKLFVKGDYIGESFRGDKGDTRSLAVAHVGLYKFV